MDYVALLRGINVGGNNKIDMKLLKKQFEENGFTNVKTYINSGNVLFNDSSKKSIPQIKDCVESLIKKEFNLNIYTIILDKSTFKKITTSIPKHWTNDETNKTDILFLDASIDDNNITKKLPLVEEIDSVQYIKGALIWNINRDFITKTGLIKLAKDKDLYSKITIRNCNTARKISELLD